MFKITCIKMHFLTLKLRLYKDLCEVCPGDIRSMDQTKVFEK